MTADEYKTLSARELRGMICLDVYGVRDEAWRRHQEAAKKIASLTAKLVKMQAQNQEAISVIDAVEAEFSREAKAA